MHADPQLPLPTDPVVIHGLDGLNPVSVWGVLRPRSVADIQQALRDTCLPVSIGGARFSQGGQYACGGSLHLDMRGMNQVLHFAPQAGRLRVQAGIRWAEVLRFLDPHDLAPAVLPRHANYTVGGAVAANAPGWGAQDGPLIEAVAGLSLVLPDGRCIELGPEQEPELFHAVIGSFGALGVIAEVALILRPNQKLQARRRRMRPAAYANWLANTLPAAAAVVHEARLALPALRRVEVTSWAPSTRALSEPARLQGGGRDAAPARGVAWLNYLCSADRGAVRWQGGLARRWARVELSLVVDADRLDSLLPRLHEVAVRHAVRLLDARLVRVAPDTRSLLAWSRGEQTCVLSLAFAHPRDAAAHEMVALWTREWLDLALAAGGGFLLDGQVHATPTQLARAYPQAEALFALKRRLDPDYRLRNSLWDAWYQPWRVGERTSRATDSVFHAVYDAVPARDALYGYLARELPALEAPALHAAIARACRAHDEDEAIHAELLAALGQLPRRSRARQAALQRAAWQTLAEQVREQVGTRDHLTGWLELGSGGELLARLAGPLRVRGDLVVAGLPLPDHGLRAWLARRRRLPGCLVLPLEDDAPVPAEAVRDNSLDLVCCARGLHGLPTERVAPLLASFYRVLRPGGLLLLCEPDVQTPAHRALAELAALLQGLVAGRTWSAQAALPRNFASADGWAARLGAVGFSEQGVRLSRVGDPLRRVCMVFVKRGLSGGRE